MTKAAFILIIWWSNAIDHIEFPNKASCENALRAWGGATGICVPKDVEQN